MTYLVSARTGKRIDAFCGFLPQKMTAWHPSVESPACCRGFSGRICLSARSVRKSNGGRHTTRHSEILRVDDHTYVVDTPGFSSLEFENLEPRELIQLFPDMMPYTGTCRFNSCLHYHEPDCSVKQAVTEGAIKEERYMTYCKILESILERKRFAW